MTVVRAGMAAIARAARAVRWYVTSMMGDTAYAGYVDHRRRTHPGAAVLSEREFWRERYAQEDANPGSRCC